MTDTLTRQSLTCHCTVCGGRTITADTDRIAAAATNPKALRELTHTLVSYGYGNSPLAAVMRGRYGVQVAA